MKTRTILILILAGCKSSSVFGQVQSSRLQSDITGSAGVSFETWKAKENKVTEFSIPIMFKLPLSPKLSMYALTSQVTSSLTSGEKFDLNGLADVKWGGHYLTLNDKLLFTFGMNLPTGKHALEDKEYSVASVLAMPAFNFRVPTLGQGLDVQLGVNTAGEFGGWIIGCGASYLMKGSYQPSKKFDAEYNPGDEITGTIGLDRNSSILGKDMQIKIDALYTMYFDDVWGGKKVFKSGNRILIQFLDEFKMGSMDMGFYVRERIKGKNMTGSGVTYDLERLNSNGNQLDIQGWGWILSKEQMRLKGLLDFKLYSDSDYNTGGATLLGFGFGGRFGFSNTITFDGDVRYYTGTIKTSLERVSAAGLKVYGGFEFIL